MISLIIKIIILELSKNIIKLSKNIISRNQVARIADHPARMCQSYLYQGSYGIRNTEFANCSHQRYRNRVAAGVSMTRVVISASNSFAQLTRIRVNAIAIDAVGQFCISHGISWRNIALYTRRRCSKCVTSDDPTPPSISSNSREIH